MAVTQTGSTTFFGLSGANPAAQSVTVPGNAQLAVFWWSGWDPTNVNITGSITLNGAAFTVRSSLAGNGTVNMIGVATLTNPATGSQSLDWAFTADCDEGPIVAIEFYTGVDITTPVRDADCTAETAATATVTIDSQVTDLVRLYTNSFGTGVANAAPASSNQTQLATSDFNSESASVGVEITSGSPTTTVTASGDFVSLVALSIIAGAGGATTSDPVESGARRNVRQNPVYRMRPSGIYAPVAYSFAA